MQLAGNLCFICGEKIVARVGASGCHLCDIAFHEQCLVDRSACPACNRSFEEIEELASREAEQAPRDDGFFGPEKKGIEAGVFGGIVMIAIAAVWFAVGYAAGYIYYYPPVLCLIGVFAVLKGLGTGNLRGN